MSKFDKYVNSPIEFEDDLLATYDRQEQIVILDIGACEGEDSIRYAKLFPRAEVWAFEPVPENFKKAFFNLVKYGASNVRLFQEALGQRIGTSLFYVSSGRPKHCEEEDGDWDYGNKSSSLLPPAHALKEHYDWLSFDKVIEVSTTTLKAFCESHGIKRIDIMHIDVQGAELMVLEGAGNFLRDTGLVRIEVEAVMLYRNQPLKNEVESFMKQQGFLKLRDTTGTVSGDQLYLNKRRWSQHKQSSILGKIRKRLNAADSPLTMRTTPDEKEGLRYAKKTFAQAGEDSIVDFVFHARGVDIPTYMDIGASHPWNISNTALFYVRGSRGISIEPNPVLFEEIAKERARDINLNIGIAKQAGELDFYVMSVPTLSTFVKTDAESHVKDRVCEIEKVLKVPVKPFNQVVSEYFFDVCPDFVSLDTEGSELEILQTIDFSRYQPKIICVETISFSTTGRGQKNHDVVEFLTSNGYLLYADTYINSIFVLKSFWQQ